MAERTYTVGEVTYTQKPLLMSQLGRLWNWVEMLPTEHVLHNVTTLQSSDSEKLFTTIRSMLLDGSLLEALSLILVPNTTVENIRKHLDENLDAATGIRMVTDFFLFNMRILSESSVMVEEQKVEMEKMQNELLSKTMRESSET